MAEGRRGVLCALKWKEARGFSPGPAHPENSSRSEVFQQCKCAPSLVVLVRDSRY